MIFDSIAGRLIDNLGWVDKGSLWVYSIATHDVTMIPVGDAGYLRLRDGKDGYFMVTCGAKVSIRKASDPIVVHAEVRIAERGATFSGDSSLWAHFDAVVRIDDKDTGVGYVQIDAGRERVKVIDLDWYKNGAYDLGYQDLVDCMTLPDHNHFVASVQRSLTLIVIDLELNRPVGSVRLPGHSGNARMTMRSADDFLASDYDTMCRVDAHTFGVQAASCLQGGGQFIGDYQLNDDGSLLVARPFSCDVLRLDSRDFSLLGRAPIHGQPLVPHLLPNGDVLARDWQTGTPYTGPLIPV